ncbi:hypothetical protein JOD82_001824 [Paenibacillus sp. 1182]|nr:hypothetical protein [Paenibacillus sp. 1182]
MFARLDDQTGGKYEGQAIKDVTGEDQPGGYAIFLWDK